MKIFYKNLINYKYDQNLMRIVHVITGLGDGGAENTFLKYA